MEAKMVSTTNLQYAYYIDTYYDLHIRNIAYFGSFTTSTIVSKEREFTNTHCLITIKTLNSVYVFEVKIEDML